MPFDPAHLARLRPLLDEALDLDTEQRAAWLALRQREDPELARELKVLLAEEDQLDREGFLGETGRKSFLTGGRGTLAGQRIGQYTLVESLGQGGMGSVWLASRNDGRFEGEVAIKFLNLALASEVGEKRFRREGTLLARLAHPNIARLTDAGVSESGQPYLVLERVAGVPLDQYCVEHRLAVRERIVLFQQVLTAVAHAHAHLIVHRDLKPSNILVTADGTAKLLDFGIAKLLENEPESAPRTTLTDEGGKPFTPECAAPEQIQGEPISAATDVYSLGVLLYKLLSGRHPTSEACKTPTDYLRAIVESEPTRLSDAVNAGFAVTTGSSPDRLKRLYLGDLENILNRALRKTPAERYPTAAALADDLNRYLRNQPVSARADTLGYRVTKFVQRHRSGVAVGVLGLVLLIGGSAFSLRQMFEARRQRDEARFQARRADAQLSFHNMVFASLGQEPITTRDILDRGRRMMEEEFIGDPRFNASILQMLSLGYSQIGVYDVAQRMLRESDSLARVAGSGDILLQNGCRRVNYLASQDSAAEAHAVLDSLTPKLTGAAPSDLADCLMQAAELAIDDRKADSGVVLARRAIELMTETGDTSKMEFLGALNTLANAFENSRKERDALAVYQRIAEFLDRRGHRETVTRTVVDNNIGIALSDLGQLVEALPVLQRTADLFARSNPEGEVHPAIIINLARTLLALRQLDSAEAWTNRLLIQAVRNGHVEMQLIGTSLLLRLNVLQGNLPKAEAQLQHYRALTAKASRQTPQDLLEMEGRVEAARGRFSPAYEKYLAALRATGYFDGRRGSETGPLLLLVGSAALESGRTTEALQYARVCDSVFTRDSMAATRSAYLGEARLLEARALLAASDSASARSMLSHAAVALSAGAGANHPLTLQADSLRRVLR